MYNPVCITFCSELCHKKCQDKCHKTHCGGCQRGQVPEIFGFCPIAEDKADQILIVYTTFEKVEVNLGKGSTFTRVEQVCTPITMKCFIKQYKKDFLEYGQHILTYWFMHATKIEVFDLSPVRFGICTCTSDFGEAIVCIDKGEISEGFYHH